MASVNSIKAERMSNNMLKTCIVGLMAAVGIGFISLPVKADEIIQEGVQTTVQHGEGNTSVQQLHQNAKAEDAYRDYGHYGYDNDDLIRQQADQFTRQDGYNNTSVEQMNQDAKIRKEGSFWRY